MGRDFSVIYSFLDEFVGVPGALFIWKGVLVDTRGPLLGASGFVLVAPDYLEGLPL